jgi:kumamolisin
MAMTPHRVPLPGSERAALPGARAVGTPHPEERLEVTIDVRSRSAIKGLPAAEPLGALLPHERQYLSREAFAATHGADPNDLAKVEAFAHEHGLTMVEVSAAKRSIKLSGTVADLSAAFGVYLATYEYPGGTYRGRVGPIHVPAELAEIIQAVRGLDNRPQAKPHFRVLPETLAATVSPAAGRAPHAGSRAFTPLQIGRLYDFPTGVTGQGQCIAIIELGGGYRTRDLQAYFAQLGLPTPTVKAISVDGGHNHPTGNPQGPDGEVMLDLEVAGAVAPGATLAVYFAPNTDQGFLDAIKAAIHDPQNHPAVLSISWGGPESSWTAQSLQAYDQAFQEAALLGVTVCCAAGDEGSSDGVSDGQAHVDFPASSPHVLGCGGTRLEGSNTNISTEVVWNDGEIGGAGGGGISDFFPLPTYQNAAPVPPSANPGGKPGRGVPDIAGDADPATGYEIRVDGRQAVFGGTSAVAPLWAGLLALINQQLGHPVGYLNPLLYSSPLATAGAFHDITTGTNGVYQAGPGWDPCTGLGSPDGTKLMQALTGPAGTAAGGQPRRETRGGRA